jgi:hypothetical protein
VDSPADHPGNESATPLATAVAPCGGVLLGPGEVQDAIKEGWIGAERARAPSHGWTGHKLDQVPQQ